MTAPVSPTTDHLSEATRQTRALIAATAEYPQCEAAAIAKNAAILAEWLEHFPTDPADVEAEAHCVRRAANIVVALAVPFSRELGAIADQVAAHVRDLTRQRAVVS